MPELPEVEALRRSLLPFVLKSKIKTVRVLQDKIVAGKGTKRTGSFNNTVRFIKNIIDKKIIDIKRRAKNLMIILNDGSILLVHLKMTGQLVFVGKDEKLIHGGHPIEESGNMLPHKHTYIIFELSNGTLYYNDVRQFGYVLYYENESILEQEKHFEGIGMEPFDKEFTLKYFINEIEKLKERKIKTPIKKILLDQKIVVGCGNIYCDEICWSSGVLPTRPINKLTLSEAEKIYNNIIDILDRAINSGGSSVANYLLADGKRGNYADYHNVYQKQNTKCKKKGCKGVIKKIEFVGRGTHFCPIHQK